MEKGLINDKDAKRGIKILDGGELKKVLVVKVPVSKAAEEKIIKVGGVSDA